MAWWHSGMATQWCGGIVMWWHTVIAVYCYGDVVANTISLPIVVLMLIRCLRRWPNIKALYWTRPGVWCEMSEQTL